MTKHKQIIDSLTSKYKGDDNIYALLVTGSVAREEQTDNSDLDLLAI